MGNRQFTDDASSILAATITSSSLTIQVSAGQGALFPTPTGTQYFIATIQDTSGNVEYIKVTSISGDVLTVPAGGRGQEGTTAIGFTANLARVELRNTAGTMAAMYQKDGDTLSGPMNLGAQTLTNGTLGANISLENCTEIVNTPIRGATGVTSNQLVVPTDGTRATVGGLKILATGDALPVFTIGMIILWNGSVPAIPAGWNLCDGTSGTPDLRDKFVIAAGSTYALGQTGSITSGTSAVSAGTPSTNPYTLAVTDIPAHAHPFDYFGGSTTQVIGNPAFGAPGNYLFYGGTGGVRNSYAGSQTGGGGPHSHTSSPLAAHSHTVTTDPFYGLYYIMKTT